MNDAATQDAPIVSIANEVQRIGLVPREGGSVAFWEVRRGEAWHPIWRPRVPPLDDGRIFPGNLPLVPWSNRLTGGGLTVDGVFYPMRPNRPDAPYPLHGNGWMQAWAVERHDESMIELGLVSRQHFGYPYDYTAWQRYWLDGATMRMELEVEHNGDRPMPYGLAWHPFILSGADADGPLLQFAASGYWAATAESLPTEHHSSLPPGFDFNTSRPLSQAAGVDNIFTGWDGRMRMERADIDLAIDWHTPVPAGLDLCILFSPRGKDFFCFEPVTHITDAFNRPGMPGARVLERGQRMALEVIQHLSHRTAG